MQHGSSSTSRGDGQVDAGDHPPARDLTAYLTGSPLAQETIDAIETHLETCAHCLERAADIAPDDFQARIRRIETSQVRAPHAAVRLTAGYELLEELGRGGAGIVYRARQLGLDREVAFKTLLAGAVSSAQQLARFRQESQALARIDHRYIVKVFDVGEQAGAPYLAMELVLGATLSELLRARPLELAVAAQLVWKLADAVQSAHEQGVLHRDLKPQNILLQEADPERPKIADFGLSHLYCAEESITRTGDPLGTPSYMSPEQVAGSKDQLTGACDVYGLGAILYECISGRPPFRGATAIETMQMVLRQDPVSLRQVRTGVPRDLETICARALEKDPARRYASAAELRDDLAAFQQRRPIVARPRSLAYRTALWVRRNPWPAAWCSTMVAALLAGLMFLLAYQHRLAAERDLASRNYAVARSAIWSMINVAGQRNSFQVPMLSELTLEQARHALGLFEELAKQDQSREAQLDLARIRMHTGTLLLALGHNTEGASLLALAGQSLSQLVDVSTVSTTELRTLLGSQGKLAVAMIGQKRLDEARRILEPAISLAEKFQRSQPNDVPLTSSAGWLHDHMATLAFHARNFDEMKSHIGQAIEFHSHALQLNPGNPQLATQLAESRVNLAQAEGQSGNLVASEREYRSAIDALESLTSSKEPKVQILVSLAIARLNLSNVMAAQDNPRGAVACCSRGIKELETVLAVEPNHADAREHRYQLYGNRGMYLAALKEYEGAICDWQAALDFATNDAIKPYCRTMKIRCLLDANQLDAADREAMAMDLPELPPADRFQLAAVWGSIGKALLALGPDDRAGDRFDRAAAIVRQLHELGYFQQDRAAAESLLDGEDFRELRPRLPSQLLESLTLDAAAK